MTGEVTLTPTEFEALEAFRKIAQRELSERPPASRWIGASRLAQRAGKGGRLAQALRRLAKKGAIRQHPTSDFYFRLSEDEENAAIAQVARESEERDGGDSPGR